jgi:hypothetical protein
MPKVSNIQNKNKKPSKAAVSAKNQNEKLIQQVFETDEYSFARVDKNLGHCFVVIRNDGSTVQGYSKYKKGALMLSIGDVVILEKSEKRAKSVEIIGLLSKRDAQKLYKAKRLAKCVYLSPEEQEKEDDLFDHSGDDDDSDDDNVKEKDKASKKKSVNNNGADDSDSDVDIDEI